MQRALSLLLISFSGLLFAENTIIAVVNNEIISLKSIENKIIKANSKEEKIEILYKQIDNILQLKKAAELSIIVSRTDISSTILEIASTNGISIEQLRSYPEFSSLEIEVAEKISILNLQRHITKDITISENEAINICSKEPSNNIKQIKIAQIIISEIEAQTLNDKDIAIKAFLNKLSKHISKGASFTGLAKLHSQHSSYFNGGITDWIEVNNSTVKMLDSLKDNEVSEIYLTDFGLAIGIKLEERFVSSNLKKCKEKLIYLKAEKFYYDWVKNLREDAYIKIYHDAL
ncbi:peptidylprolyl isomerase [Candidatus Pseudothioglobus sp. Uisw_050_01]|uniref:peptidylprolyl isomerase n=1 Tax=Candidatus Pseudothioglobus sp. Uisw_050_01 TaxID=3230997 RepID=UPI003A83E5C0